MASQISVVVKPYTFFVCRCPREPSCDDRHGGDAEHNTTEGAHVRDGAVWGWHRWGCSALWVSGGPRCLPGTVHCVAGDTFVMCLMDCLLALTGNMAIRMGLGMALAVKRHALLRIKVTRTHRVYCGNL